MTVLDYILAGFEAELALERELGIREVPCERALVGVSLEPKIGKDVGACCEPEPVVKTEPIREIAHKESIPEREIFAPPSLPPAPPKVEKPVVSETSDWHDIVFLHDRPLTPFGIELMNKAIAGLGYTVETAPILISGELPHAHVYVILGANALKKWFPGIKASPGQWKSQAGFPNILVTYTPAYFERFKVVDAALGKVKTEFWLSLKGAKQRARVAKGENI